MYTLYEALTPVNHDHGRRSQIRGICIHTAEGKFQGTIDWFHNPSSLVSSHYLVSEDGSQVAHIVHESDTAYAEGRVLGATNKLVLEYGGNPNDYFISIENADNLEPGTFDRNNQLPTLIDLIADICRRNNIPCDRDHICGHHEIYNPKSCPGNISVDYVVSEVFKLLSGPTSILSPTVETVDYKAEYLKILSHFGNVKTTQELFSSQDQQNAFLGQARSDLQKLREQYADYDKIKATRDAYFQQYDDLCMWLKEVTGSATDDIAINKAEVVTRFGKESDLAQSLNDAQKALDSERQRHLSDVANLTTRANDLDVSIQKQQSEYVLLQNQVHDLQTQLSSQQQTGIKLTWIQQVVLNLQLLVKGKK